MSVINTWVGDSFFLDEEKKLDLKDILQAGLTALMPDAEAGLINEVVAGFLSDLALERYEGRVDNEIVLAFSQDCELFTLSEVSRHKMVPLKSVAQYLAAVLENGGRDPSMDLLSGLEDTAALTAGIADAPSVRNHAQARIWIEAGGSRGWAALDNRGKEDLRARLASVD